MESHSIRATTNMFSRPLARILSRSEAVTSTAYSAREEEPLSLAEFGLLSASFATLLATCMLGILLPG